MAMTQEQLMAAQALLNNKNKKSKFVFNPTEQEVVKQYWDEGDNLVENMENNQEAERLKKERLDAANWAQDMNSKRKEMSDKPYISPEEYNAMKYEIFKRNILKNKRIIDPKTIDDLIRQNMNQ